MIRKIFFLILLTALLSGRAGAQFYSTGDDPASIKWNVIKTPNYRVVYPMEVDSLAQQYTWLLESTRQQTMSDLQINPDPIEVILHPYNLLSNGVVSWAPKRVELYTTPQVSADFSLPWDLQLVLHESAHVGQLEHFTGKNMKLFYAVFGQMATGFAAGAYAGQYFLEGDAVYRETHYSPAGRGRKAQFFEYYRAAFLSGEQRNRRQWRYGSYKKYAPSIYEFGYLQAEHAHSIAKTPHLSARLLKYMADHFYNPYSDLSAYNRYITKGSYNSYFNSMKDWYLEKWRADLERREITEAQTIPHKESSFYQTYVSPVVVSPDSVIYIKRGYAQPTSLVMVSTNTDFVKQHRGGEKTLQAFSSNTSQIKGNSKFLVWSEITPSARWVHKNNSNIYLYDIASGDITKITHGERLFNPMPDESGERISAIKYDVQGESSVKIFRLSTREELCEITGPGAHIQILETIWCSKWLYALGLDVNGVALYRVDIMKILGSGELYMNNRDAWSRVSGYSYSSISNLSQSKGAIYFESDFDGVDNIYCVNEEDLIDLDPNSGTTIRSISHRVTNSLYGAHSPFATDDGRVYYSNVTLDGYKPVYTEFDSEKLNERDTTIFTSTLWEQPSDSIIRETRENYLKPAGVKYDSERYYKAKHLFNLHSWAPFYINPNRIMNSTGENTRDYVSLGATLLSQNKLGTLVSLFGYSYRPGYHGGHIMAEYTGLYPVFRLEADYNSERRSEISVEKDDQGYVLKSGDARGHLFELQASVYVPFNFSRGGWNSGFVPQVLYKFDNNKFYDISGNKYLYNEMIAGFTLYKYRKMSHSEVYPRWGGGIKAFSKFCPTQSSLFASSAAIEGYAYAPGFGSIDGFRLGGGFQKSFTDGKIFYMSNLISMPRGYEKMYGENYWKVTLDYQVPVYLGDFNIWWLLYATRMRFTPFADFAGLSYKARVENGPMKTEWTNISSYGIEASLDGYYLSIGYPASLGVRYSYRQMARSGKFELLFSISL